MLDDKLTPISSKEYNFWVFLVIKKSEDAKSDSNYKFEMKNFFSKGIHSSTSDISKNIPASTVCFILIIALSVDFIVVNQATSLQNDL